jgi:DNA excision repair protein ERCC-4
MHDWFNAKSAATLVEASQARVSRKKIVMDNQPDEERDYPDEGHWGPERRERRRSSEHDDDLEALREIERGTDREEEEDLEVMESLATQTQTVPQSTRTDVEDENDEDVMREIGEDEATPPPIRTEAPPVFRPLHFDLEESLTRSVERRLRKGHEAVLEEQPKWNLLAKVLKEIEDTITRVSESHAGESLSYALRAQRYRD